MPEIIIVAGPNGAGKTSFAGEYLTTERAGFAFINADEIARTIMEPPLGQAQINMRAARAMLDQIIVKPLAMSEQRQLPTRSREMFGSRAARVHEALIRRAYRMLCADPQRSGVMQSDELTQGQRLFHLRRARTRGAPPKQPRHIIVFTSDETTLTILRVLHDSMDITQQRSNETDEA